MTVVIGGGIALATEKEALLLGTYGAVKLESVWNDDKLLAVIIKGGK